ncbi:MAG TPA: alpha/beta hydrolase [Allosphingosinicella sp.]|nr:alpha/beta hydrolase [Allosphingosinicella sp.]
MSFLLRALNMLDALLATRGTRRLARDLPYGASSRQTLDIYAPKAAGKNRPVLIFFYGGNWDSGDKHNYAFVGRAFAERGYVTVLADYTHTHERPYPAFMEDGAAAVRWVRDHIADHGGDPARIAVAGHSAGAYIAVTLALDPRWGARPAIGAAIGLAGPYDFLPFDSPVTRRTFGGAEDLESTQPVNHARAGPPPLLLATGDADTTVRPRNSTELAARVRMAGGEATLILYPGVTHTGPVKAIARPFRNHAPVLRDVAAFLGENGLGA